MGKQLNIWVDKPTYYQKDIRKEYYDEYFYIDIYGDIVRAFYNNGNIDDRIFNHFILFKDEESAENFKEFMSDVRRLQKRFEVNEWDNTNCHFLYNHVADKVYIGGLGEFQYRDYYFTENNAMWLLDKYGEDFIKKWILYCR